MKILHIFSKTHGKFDILLETKDYVRVTTLGKTSKWCVRVPPKRRNLYYFQKRLSGGELIEMHRFIMNAPKGKCVDHINGNTLDNRRSNLRICSNSANLRNRNKLQINNTSGFNGIHWDKSRNKWSAKIKVNYKDIYLGRFTNFQDAVSARKEADKLYFSV